MDISPEDAGRIEPLQSVKRTAQILDASRSTVYVLLSIRKLQAVKDGARLKVTGDSIRRHLASLPMAEINLQRPLSYADVSATRIA